MEKYLTINNLQTIISNNFLIGLFFYEITIIYRYFKCFESCKLKFPQYNSRVLELKNYNFSLLIMWNSRVKQEKLFIFEKKLIDYVFENFIFSLRDYFPSLLTQDVPHVIFQFSTAMEHFNIQLSKYFKYINTSINYFCLS